MRRHSRKPTGFTLMEVMVVVCILASLAALVATNVLGVKTEADQKTTRLDMRQTESALDLYRMQHGRFPSTAEGLEKLVDSGLLKELPRDAWGHPLLYKLENDQPQLTSLGADGEPGGSGADADLNNLPATGQTLVAQAF